MTTVKEFRRKLGMPQYEFARKLGVTQTTVSSWEQRNMKVTAGMAMAVAEVLRYPEREPTTYKGCAEWLASWKKAA